MYRERERERATHYYVTYIYIYIFPKKSLAVGVLTVLLRGLGVCFAPVTLPASNDPYNLQYVVILPSETHGKIDILIHMFAF